VAVAEDRQQDVVGAQIVRDLDRFREKNRSRRAGVQRQPRLEATDALYPTKMTPVAIHLALHE